MTIRWFVALCAIVACTGVRAEDPVIAAWANAQLGAAVDRHLASAATVAVVKGGEIVFEGYYGFADAQARTPVAPDDRFLIASVTKTVTATAVARLLERGSIRSLDDPANAYLRRVQLPRAFGRDITIRALLTHSAGFEERGFGVTNYRDAPVPATPEYLQQRLPAVVRAPGSSVVYANIDPPLLGVLIEDVSGLSYRDFIAREVLQPLGMRDSVIEYAADFGRTVKAFRPGRDDALEALPIEANAPFYAPTGSLHTTARDMSRFMLAQLGHAPGFLTPATLELMHTPLAANHPRVGSVGMAFFIDRWNGETVVGHAGLFSGFSANLVLVPSMDLGLFVAWAGAPPAGIAGLDLGAIRDSFLATQLGPFRSLPRIASAVQPDELAGRYWRERRPQTTAEMLVGLPAVINVAANADGTLTIDGDGPYHAVAPGLFSKTSDGSRAPRLYAFDRDRVLMTADVARRVSGFQDPQNVVLALGALTILCATGLFAWGWQRDRGALIAALLGVAALAVPTLALGPSPSGLGLEGDILAGNTFRFVGLKISALLVPGLALLLGAWLVWGRATPGKAHWRRRASQMHLTLLMLAGLLLIPAYVFLQLYG